MRRLATLLVISALMVGFSATQALAGSAVQKLDVEDLGDTVIYCAGSDRTYTFVSGTVVAVGRDTANAAHLTMVNAIAVDQYGTMYRAALTETYNDSAGRFTISVAFFDIVNHGGIADRTNAVVRDRAGLEFLNGACTFAD
jgi:hypothetical protein